MHAYYQRMAIFEHIADAIQWTVLLVCGWLGTKLLDRALAAIDIKKLTKVFLVKKTRYLGTIIGQH